MAQGLLKKPAAARPTTSSTTKNGVTKKGALKFNPKKSKLIKQAKINKKFTAGLTAQTEKMLGERAGHLELLGQGRKKAQEPKGHGKSAKVANMGGKKKG